MERPGFTIILSLAGGLSLLSSAVCGIGVAVLIANGGQTQKPDIQSITVLTAAALQSLVSYAVCAANVWLIDRHCAESNPQQPCQPPTINSWTSLAGPSREESSRETVNGLLALLIHQPASITLASCFVCGLSVVNAATTE